MGPRAGAKTTGRSCAAWNLPRGGAVTSLFQPNQQPAKRKEKGTGTTPHAARDGPCGGRVRLKEGVSEERVVGAEGQAEGGGALGKEKELAQRAQVVGGRQVLEQRPGVPGATAARMRTCV